MRYIKNLLLALLFTMLMPLSQAATGDTTMVYAQEQMNRIVVEEVEKAVKAEVARQVDTEFIDLKIDKKANEKLNGLQAEHDALISHHLTIIGLIITFFAAIIGIFIPLLLNKKADQRLKNAKGEADLARREASERAAKTEAEARARWEDSMSRAKQEAEARAEHEARARAELEDKIQWAMDRAERAENEAKQARDEAEKRAKNEYEARVLLDKTIQEAMERIEKAEEETRTARKGLEYTNKEDAIIIHELENKLQKAMKDLSRVQKEADINNEEMMKRINETEVLKQKIHELEESLRSNK